ncbi:MAG: DUF1553 domain-containing protein [Bryobacteraceae bacterium]
MTQRKRAEFWRQSSFFGDLRIYRAFGIGQEFAVKEDQHRFDVKHPSVKRVQRYRMDVAPTFILTGDKPASGENPRQAYARMLTSHPQFARTAVNMIWAELMGVGIVDPPFEFDMDRQDPKNPPPAPWTVQPTHPELLDALSRICRQQLQFATHHASDCEVERLPADLSIRGRVEVSLRLVFCAAFCSALVR